MDDVLQESAKRIIRNIIDYGDGTSIENLVRNFELVKKTVDNKSFMWTNPVDENIYAFVSNFVYRHFEVPSIQTATDYFQSINGLEAQERMKAAASAPSYIRTNFVHLLRSIREEQAKGKLVALMREAGEIMNVGIKDKKTGEVLKGVTAAVESLSTRLQDIIISDYPVKVFGDIRAEADEICEEVHRAVADQGRSIGVLCGIDEIDEACTGLKRGELWIHAAHPGELKTTFGYNWCYNAATLYNTNVVFVSLEMPREQIRRCIYTVHASNAKFLSQGYQQLDYRDIRDGKLTPEQLDYFTNVVAKDFKDSTDYAHFDVVTPDREWTVQDIWSQLERLNKEMEVEMVVIDYAEWVKPDIKHKEYTQQLNSIITGTKNMALHFDHNRGIPVLMLFQTNRDGKDRADKNEGVYNTRALSYANMAEKSADVITTTYLNDELKKNNQTKFCCLKNRDNPFFDPFLAHVNFSARRIISPRKMEGSGFSAESHEEMMALMFQDV